MRKPRLLTFLFLIAIMFLSTVNFVRAKNMFDDVTLIFQDTVMFISAIFNLDYLNTPEKAFGFLMFLMWVLLFTIIYIGATAALGRRGGNRNQIMVVSLIFATMAVVMMYWQKEFVKKIFGGWVMWLYFLLVLGVPFLIIRAGWQATNDDLGGWLVRAFLMLFGMVILGIARKDVIKVVDELEKAMEPWVVIPLYNYIKLRLQDDRGSSDI